MFVLHFIIVLLTVVYTSGQRIAEQKCAEYSQLDFSSGHFIFLLPEDTKPQLEIDNKCRHYEGFLIGKENFVESGEYPHMAVIGTGSGKQPWICSGSLISERYVLTVAHCVSNRYTPTTVRLGGYNLRDTAAAGSKSVDILIEKINVHPDFNKPKSTHDIALIKLSQAAEFNYFVRPACLYTNMDTPLGKVINTNYGLLLADEDSTQQILNKISLHVLSKDDRKCEIFKRFYNTEDKELCVDNAGFKSNGVLEESGSPIQIPSKNDSCVYHILGLASLKIDMSGNGPTLYTKIPSYLDWIEEIVWGQQ